ncbi:MAG: invasion associated locus B family protein [Pseudomonadota bacterium]
MSNRMSAPSVAGPAAAKVAALALAALLPAGAALAQNDELRTTHGDWQVRCAPGTDECVIAQIGKGPNGGDVLEVRIRKIQGLQAQDGEAVPAAIQILAPLGVALKAGVRVQVDSKEVRGAPFEVCAQGGCVVREPMSETFVDEMKAGNRAKISLAAITQSGEAQQIDVTVSLSGFTRAYNAISP